MLKDYQLISFPSTLPTEYNYKDSTPKDHRGTLLSCYPTIKEYGGHLDTYDDVKAIFERCPLEATIIAWDLYNNNIYEIFTDDMIEYIKNAVRVYTKVMDSPCDLLPWWQEINPQDPGHNLYHRIIEKYHWEE